MRVEVSRSSRIGDTCDLYTAGQRVSAGSYRDIDNGRVVVLTVDGNLPGSCNGRVATYIRRQESRLSSQYRAGMATRQ